MLVKETTCYSHILYLLTYHGEAFSSCSRNLKINRPNFEAEGVAGYIQTDVEIEVTDLTKFAKLWDSWYSAPNRTELYAMAKGLNCENRLRS